MSFKIGSLFDGSGGFPLAAFMCGGEPVWASEIEPYPIAVTKTRFPYMKHLGSVTDVKGNEVEPVDVITFGSPCQDLSVAGKRAGLKHEDNGDEETTRSGLFMEAVRIIKEMREKTNGEYPRFAVWENVPGAFSSNKGEDFRIVLEELIKIADPTAVMPTVPKNGWPYADCYIGDGWSIAYRVFDAQYWGVPQRRRRIYLVLDLRGECAGKILFEREGLRGYFTESRTPWKTVTGNAENSVGATDSETDSVIPYSIENHPADSRVNIDYSGKVQTLTGRMGTGGGNVPMVLEPKVYESHPMDSRIKELDGIAPTVSVKWHKGAADTPLVCEPIPIHDQATRFSGKHGDKSDGKGNGLGVGEIGDPMNTLTGGDRHAVAYTSVRVYSRQRSDEFIENSVVSTQSFRQYKDATDLVVEESVTQSHQNTVGVQYIVRRLTPTECARLQGFADEWAHPDTKTEFTDEEYAFWLKVRNTHAEINGKTMKDYTREQMLAWYNKLHTDSSEYKLWGNGIALPCALYVMQGIAEVYT